MSNAGRPSQRGNGNVPNPNVPPNLEWDEDNPPFVYECSEYTEHRPECNGECEGRFWVESEVKLSNLAKEYARNQMSYAGVIEAYRAVPILPGGFPVDPFYHEMWLESLQDILIDKGLVTRDELNELWRQKMITRMETVLGTVLPQLKEARTKAALGIQDKKIIGPGGYPIG